MKSKAHFKKCTELGLNPVPTQALDEDGCEFDDSASMTSEKNYSNANSDTDDGDESDDMDTDSDGALCF